MEAIGIVVVLLLVGYFAGTFTEKRHLEDLDRRERLHREFVTATIAQVPSGHQVVEILLVSGSAVVSLDYFKRFLAGLRGIVGGRIRSYETLLDRARREALLRMREQAVAGGYSMVINVRLETARLASTASNGRGTAGVEVLAFGTALKTARQAAGQASGPTAL